MALPNLVRLKSQLAVSPIRETDNATWQVISQLIDYLQQSNTQLTQTITAVANGAGTGGITQLTGDVTAGPGIGIQVATITPNAVGTLEIINNAVTYEKIQQISQTEVLLGNGNIVAPANVQEIGLGPNLRILSDELQIINDNGEVGLGHQLLSETHEDTIPADAVYGDLIYAGLGQEVQGTYAHALLNSSIVEDFEGIRAGYQLSFNNIPALNGISGWGATPPLEYINNPLPNNWLTWNLIDGFLSSSVVEDFIGIRNGYLIPYPYVTGNNGAYSGPLLDTIPVPDLINFLSGGNRWTRLPIGLQNQVLQPQDGIPVWRNNLLLAGDALIGGNTTVFGNFGVIGVSTFIGSSTHVGAVLNQSTLTQQGLLDLQSGHIQFPATQVPSAGVNVLDDYEEGTWTPVLTFGGASVGITYSRQLAVYTKIGNLVCVRVRIILTSKGVSVGNAIITGLPFAHIADSMGTTGNLSVFNMTGMTGFKSESFISATESQIRLFDNASTGTIALTDVKFNNNSDLTVQVSYNA